VRGRAVAAAVVLAGALTARVALGDGGDRPAAGAQRDDATGATSTGDLRAHFGIEVASSLLKSPDSNERLRGVQRAASMRTPEALTLLEKAVDQGGAARTDARAAIEVARALADFTGDVKARGALESLASLQWSLTATRGSQSSERGFATSESDHLGRLLVARHTAALALARSGDPKTLEHLLASVKGGGVGSPAAAAALRAYPPVAPGAWTVAGLASASATKLVADLGDLRALEPLRTIAKSTDVALKSAALLALCEMGDMRALDLAGVAAKDRDPRVRVAGVEALVLLGVPDGTRGTEALVANDATAFAGMRLAERVSSDGIVKALAARAATSGDLAIRTEAVLALGRSSSSLAVRVLVALLKDPTLHGDIANALARSPHAEALSALEAMVTSPIYRRLGVRAYVVRALVRGERSRRIDDALAELVTSQDGRDRAVAAGALVALGEREPATALGDADPRVRRAVAVASLAVGPDAKTRAALLDRLVVETDAATRDVLSIGLVGGDPDARVPTVTLVDRADAAGPDAGLAVMALARRADDSRKEKVDALFGSPDPILRAHVARGLGASEARDAVGRLADAYAYEPEPAVRRAVVIALASRSGADKDAPLRMTTLRLAARLDPDAAVRAAATRALAGLPPTLGPGVREVAWLHLTAPDGGPPPSNVTGALVRADGLAIPCAFDDEGYAVVPGVPPGDVQLVLAPRLPAYEGGKR
jgi:HEAT repeat protein